MRLLRLFVVLVLAGCGGSQMQLSRAPSSAADAYHAGSPIKHIIVVVQENRTVDDLFQFLPGADVVRRGLNSKGQHVPLAPIPLTERYDLAHHHSDWLTEYDGGAMNGFDKEGSTSCRGSCPPPNVRAYGYVPQEEVQPYYDLAEQYAFADETFESNQGPSFPAHQYLVSGTSTIYTGANLRASENAIGKHSGEPPGGCDSRPGSYVQLISRGGYENKRTFPCFDRSSIISELDDASVSWLYYQYLPGTGDWHAVDALKPIWQNKNEYATHVITPSSQFLTDIGNGNLAAVTWITPTIKASDHALRTNGSGPAWVASVVNAVGESPFWNSSAIIITWDDWGGWYDHVKPTVFNSYEDGFRVPLIVVSPYAVQGISHQRREIYGATLRFIEDTFNLPSLGTTDVRNDDLSDMFNFRQLPKSFAPIAERH
ncbi:MAG: alkaline phosphatase family protein [Candidatus Cybelea sp.]